MINMLTLLSLPFFAAPTAAVPDSSVAAPADSAAMTLIVVQNERNVPVTIYAENEFGEYNLGIVNADGTQTIQLARYMVEHGALKFFVQPKGQLEESSDPIDVDIGQRIGLVVPVRK